MARLLEKQLIGQLIDKFEPTVRKAFLDAVSEIRDNITLKTVADHLERGDVQGAISVLHLNREAFAKLELAITDAYNSGGQAFVGNMPQVRDPSGNIVIFRFGVRNTPGEQELRSALDKLTTTLTDEAQDVARSHLVEGFSQGKNPTQTAVELIGRVNRVTGKREGGVIGLSRPQERYVASAREELASGDPAALRNYLTRSRRDKRFDRTVAKAIRDEKPLPKETVDRIAGRYSDGLLKLRGDMIGLNETMAAMGKSRHDAMRQQIDAGKVDQQDVTKVWHHSADEHPRLHHLALDGTSVGYEERFQVEPGVTMRYPHDPDAPASQTIFCRCWLEYRISYIDALVRKRKAE